LSAEITIVYNQAQLSPILSLKNVGGTVLAMPRPLGCGETNRKADRAAQCDCGCQQLVAHFQTATGEDFEYFQHKEMIKVRGDGYDNYLL
jgi:hypothetical protein